MEKKRLADGVTNKNSRRNKDWERLRRRFSRGKRGGGRIRKSYPIKRAFRCQADLYRAPVMCIIYKYKYIYIRRTCFVKCMRESVLLNNHFIQYVVKVIEAFLLPFFFILLSSVDTCVFIYILNKRKIHLNFISFIGMCTFLWSFYFC